jgi:hypothetical protein
LQWLDVNQLAEAEEVEYQQQELVEHLFQMGFTPPPPQQLPQLPPQLPQQPLQQLKQQSQP